MDFIQIVEDWPAVAPKDDLCWECQKAVAVIPRRDSSNILGVVCPSCNRYLDHELSFG